MTFDLADMYAWLFALFRGAALVFSAPVFSHPGFPRTAKLGFAALLAWLVAPEALPAAALPAHPLALGLVVGKELAIGFLMGFAVRAVFALLDFAARVLAVEIGLHPPPEFDSTANVAGNPLGASLYYLGVVIFFSGAHYAMIVAFTRSFELVPPGLQTTDMSFVGTLVAHTARIIALGVLIAAPFIAVNFLVNLTFSMLGRVVPRMNVFVLSFSVRILAGMGMLAFAAGLFTHYLLQEMGAVPEVMLRFLPRPMP
jgi:flagellar biosynthetic protein FliR